MLGLTHEEIREILNERWAKMGEALRALPEDANVGDLVDLRVEHTHLLVLEVVEANNRRLADQLEKLGVLPRE